MVGVSVEREVPNVFDELGPTEHTVRVAHQVLQQPEFLRRERHCLVPARHGARRRIEHQITDGHDASDARGRPRRTTGAIRGEQLVEHQRLRHVVVGAEIEEGDPVGDTVARSHDDDRNQRSSVRKARSTPPSPSLRPRSTTRRVRVGPSDGLRRRTGHVDRTPPPRDHGPAVAQASLGPRPPGSASTRLRARWKHHRDALTRSTTGEGGREGAGTGDWGGFGGGGREATHLRSIPAFRRIAAVVPTTGVTNRKRQTIPSASWPSRKAQSAQAEDQDRNREHGDDRDRQHGGTGHAVSRG